MRLGIKPELFDEFRNELARNHPEIISNISNLRKAFIRAPDRTNDLIRICYPIILREAYGYHTVFEDFKDEKTETIFRIKYSEFLCT